MKRSLFFATLIAMAGFAFDSVSAESTNSAPSTVTVPPPVPGYPIGWCIRAKAEVFAQAKWAGFEYVELALQDVLNLSDDDFAKLSTALQATGLPARSGYNPIPKELKLVGPDVDQAKLDAHVSHLLARATALKLPYIVLNSAASWKVPDGFEHDKAFAQLAAFGVRFADTAKKSGITILLEPMRGSDANMITNIAEALKLVQAVNKPNFQMMVDYSFLTIQKDDMNALLSVGKHLQNIHISNPAANRTYAMTDGESDYATFFSALKKINYRGGLSVHGGPLTNFTNDAPRAIAFLRAKARELAGGEASASAADITKGWKEVPFKYEVQHPYDLDLKERYKFDPTTGTHDFWVFFTDKPHALPPNKTTARTEMRLETFTAGEHMFDGDVYIQPGTFACIGQVFDQEHGPIAMVIAHPDGNVTVGKAIVKTNAIGKWWNLKMTNDPGADGKIRIYSDNVLIATMNSRGPRTYYFKCGVYSRKDSDRSEVLFRNIKMWVKENPRG